MGCKELLLLLGGGKLPGVLLCGGCSGETSAFDYVFTGDVGSDTKPTVKANSHVKMGFLLYKFFVLIKLLFS